ncbi:helix-turn-helix domain-containing protein [Marinobacterium rhizophilum]|uniref:AraC family transcriptional regulator n=1 Tax=Marinobacterium rhizophilum TaxID=420402 RepID=A0ABY5HH00_9GAMM|nr:AraC family transcriptional regulator [Marinobacterium rhizophilum]UTW10535.1 AraC family transcriptional regulator [Marinobacterium rhizophilum]
MHTDPQRLPDYEWVDRNAGESIHYTQHGVPSPLIRWHHHREFELHLVRATCGRMFVGDYIGNFRPGTLVLVAPDLPHNWISNLAADASVPLRDQVIHFPGALLHDAQTVFAEMHAFTPLLARAQRGLEFTDPDTVAQACALFDAIAQARGLKRLVCFLTLLELLTSCPQSHTLSSAWHRPLTDSKQLDWLNSAVDYVLQHYERELPLDEVARHMDTSQTQFSKRFKRASGHRFVDFVNMLRVSRASELLAYSEEPITAICFEVGYNNIANFNRRFLDIKGMTPSEYRKAVLQRIP